MKHELDDDLPIFGDQGDITDPDERYAFFEGLVEEKFKVIRANRNRLLTETDHWAYQDTPNMTQEQIDYRQALRDITNQEDPDNIVWPIKP